jgi:hypothetical protein
MSTITFYEVNPKSARELLVNAFRGQIGDTQNQEVDTYEIEYKLSDEQVLGWLSEALSGRGLHTRVVYQEDGTVTHYPQPR